jgi:hypothetical protein
MLRRGAPRINRALKALELASKIARYGDYVWLLGQQRGEHPAGGGSVTKRDKTLDGHADPAHPSVTKRDMSRSMPSEPDFAGSEGQRDKRDNSVTKRDMSRAGEQRDKRDSPPIGGVTFVTLTPRQPGKEISPGQEEVLPGQPEVAPLTPAVGVQPSGWCYEQPPAR